MARKKTLKADPEPIDEVKTIEAPEPEDGAILARALGLRGPQDDNHAIKTFRFITQAITAAGTGGAVTIDTPAPVQSFYIPEKTFRHLDELEVAIAAVQSGSGDPAPDNVRPISGWSSAKVTRTGKNLIDLSSLRGGGFDMAGIFPAANICTNDYVPIKGGQTYLWSQKRYPTSGGRYVRWYDINKVMIGSTVSIYSASPNSISAPNDACFVRFMWYQTTYWQSVDEVIADEPMFELGSTASDYEPYLGTTFTISLGDTRYGAVLDVTRGKLLVTHVTIASYAGEPINEPWVSSMDVYASGTTPTTGAQVVYPLTTPLEVDVSPAAIDLLEGQNNIFCDTGDVTRLSYSYENMI